MCNETASVRILMKAQSMYTVIKEFESRRKRISSTDQHSVINCMLNLKSKTKSVLLYNGSEKVEHMTNMIYKDKCS